jgi:NAD(P)-dependent dehydrogenase (short-subunit alcohol dehydrogenase family)
MTSQPFAVVAGVGPGTGASVARRFAKAYPVVLLARNAKNFKDLAEQINKDGGKAIGISADVSNQDSLKKAFSEIEKQLGSHCAAAVFNAAGGFVRKPFLEVTEEEFASGWEVSQYVLHLASTNSASLGTA